MREAIGCSNDLLGKTRTVGGMACVVNNHQLGARPHAVKFPCVCNGGLEVKATIHQDAKYVGQYVRVAQEDAVLQPQIVMHIVSHNTRKRQRERGIGEARGVSR